MAKIKMYLDIDGEWWVRQGKTVRHISLFAGADGGPTWGVGYAFATAREMFELRRVRKTNRFDHE